MTTSQELFGDEHVRRYIETDGEEGYEWRNGTKILVLFTKGRKSGEERANALIMEPDGDDYLIVASKGGAPTPPAWFLNLEANPDVRHARMNPLARFLRHGRDEGRPAAPSP